MSIYIYKYMYIFIHCIQIYKYIYIQKILYVCILLTIYQIMNRNDTNDLNSKIKLSVTPTIWVFTQFVSPRQLMVQPRPHALTAQAPSRAARPLRCCRATPPLRPRCERQQSDFTYKCVCVLLTLGLICYAGLDSLTIADQI